MTCPDNCATLLSSLFFADLRMLARERLDPGVFDYIDCAAGDERTARDNETDLASVRFLPLCLRDVRSPQLRTTLFGCEFDAPIGISPMAFHKLAHPEGEIATAGASRDLNVPLIVSSMSSVSLEDIAARAAHRSLWLQLYIFRDRAVTKELVSRAAEAGYKAIVLTVGSPVPGIRDRNIRNRFTLPDWASAANFDRSPNAVYNNPIHSFRRAELDPGATWRDVEWLGSQTRLPIVLKGVMNSADAQPAVGCGASGVIVSNHGGRQLDGTMSTIRALPEVVAALDGRLPTLVDSGFRRGADVAKALALGADTVLLGRPILWALAADGRQGVISAMKQLVEELKVAMQLLGCETPAELRRMSTQILRMPDRRAAPEV